jgi:hypothetical protein
MGMTREGNAGSRKAAGTPDPMTVLPAGVWINWPDRG